MCRVRRPFPRSVEGACERIDVFGKGVVLDLPIVSKSQLSDLVVMAGNKVRVRRDGIHRGTRGLDELLVLLSVPDPRPACQTSRKASARLELTTGRVRRRRTRRIRDVGEAGVGHDGVVL